MARRLALAGYLAQLLSLAPLAYRLSGPPVSADVWLASGWLGLAGMACYGLALAGWGLGALIGGRR